MRVGLLELIVVTASALGMTVSQAHAGPEDPAAAQCAALQAADFSHITDAPTQVMSAKIVAADANKPAYCQVLGYVWPQVGFELQLPVTGWNGKFIEIGHGGFGGTLHWTFWCPLHRGYACIASDMGHKGKGPDAVWAYQNLQAQIDFGYRGAHVTALAGKAITEHYYGRAPKYSYFHGCSSGGQQALSEAQRFPLDFDGIISGAPSPTFSGPMMHYLWAARALVGTVSRGDLELVHERAVAKCDLDDGVKDGVIGDAAHCPFDPAELLCKSDQETSCLTRSKVEAIKKVYAGPMTSQGKKLYTGGSLPGSELNWITDKSSTAYVLGDAAAPWAREYFSYVGFMPAPGPDWKPEAFDFDRDYQRLRMAESLFGAADNPDLRKLKAAGAKMILYQGMQDESDIPSDAIDYYATAEKTMGGRLATQDFFRLFLVPGMNHCTGGTGAYAIDYLTYLEDWVERGRAPEKLIGAHFDEASKEIASPFSLRFPLANDAPIKFTRPIYPYPLHAKYRGRGDPNDAASFVPVGR